MDHRPISPKISTHFLMVKRGPKPPQTIFLMSVKWSVLRDRHGLIALVDLRLDLGMVTGELPIRRRG